MSIAVSLDLDAHTPHYEQLRIQLASLITSGELSDGARLPTVQALANDLGIASGTVARAYRELEQAGLVTSARRRGTSVTAPPVNLNRAAVVAAAHAYLDTAQAHGLTTTEAQDVLQAALGRRHAEASRSPAAASLDA